LYLRIGFSFWLFVLNSRFGRLFCIFGLLSRSGLSFWIVVLSSRFGLSF